MIILGIDPGTSLIGYGFIDYSKKGYTSGSYGVFKTPASIENKYRVKMIYDFFYKLIKNHRPQKIAIEKIFFFKNQKTVISVSEIRGVLLLLGSLLGVEIFEFTPLQVKQQISGYGKADKKQVQKMVQLVLGLKEPPRPDDAADALALAICCSNTVLY
jgi:crossover junction endodeoxyribonuclease RuvC